MKKVIKKEIKSTNTKTSYNAKLLFLSNKEIKKVETVLDKKLPKNNFDPFKFVNSKLGIRNLNVASLRFLPTKVKVKALHILANSLGMYIFIDEDTNTLEFCKGDEKILNEVYDDIVSTIQELESIGNVMPE